MQKVYSQILQIAGDVITVEAKDVGYKELAEIRTRSGVSLAQVIRRTSMCSWCLVFGRRVGFLDGG